MELLSRYADLPPSELYERAIRPTAPLAVEVQKRPETRCRRRSSTGVVRNKRFDDYGRGESKMDWTTIAFIGAVIVVGGLGFYIMKPEKK